MITSEMQLRLRLRAVYSGSRRRPQRGVLRNLARAQGHLQERGRRWCNAGATPVGCEALEMLRIAAGIPLYGVDIRERDLPQETEQMRAFNFNKGCYVGQEIVERIRSRGNVHRKFTGFVAEGAVHNRSGQPRFRSDGKEVGEVTSVCFSACSVAANARWRLGYIRREVGVPGREVTIGGIKASRDSVAIARRRAAKRMMPYCRTSRHSL